MKNQFKLKYGFRYILPIIILACVTNINAQKSSIRYGIDYYGIVSTGDYAPFWFQSNRFGIISEQPFSTNVGLSLTKSMDAPEALFDYGFSADVMAGAASGKGTNLFIKQLYLQGRLWIFDLTAGIKEKTTGISDSELSTGDFLLSGNARPIPQITAGIEKYITIPYTFDLLEIKGAISQGWFSDRVFAPDIMLHHKYLYARLGGNLPVHLEYGLDHFAQWGGNIPGNGNQKFTLENFKTIFLGRSGGEDSNRSEQINAMGNHIIETHFKLEAAIKDFKINAYWQNIMEDGPIQFLPWLAMTKRDGLWGVNISNKKLPYVNGFTYEFFRTLDQSGPWHDKDGIVFGGNDGYLKNGIYQNDWTHYGRTIGNPLILSPVYNTDGSFRIRYNHVSAHHFGLSGNICGFSYKTLGTFSKYYIANLDPAHYNTSWLVEISKYLNKPADTKISVSFGGDTGLLPGKTTGLMLTLSKTGILF